MTTFSGTPGDVTVARTQQGNQFAGQAGSDAALLAPVLIFRATGDQRTQTDGKAPPGEETKHRDTRVLSAGMITPLWMVAWAAAFASAALPVSVLAADPEVIDPLWMKTTNATLRPLQNLGQPALSIDDSFWAWTSQAWDGDQTNVEGNNIGSVFVPDDFWAEWIHRGADVNDNFTVKTGRQFNDVTERWFKTTVNICDVDDLEDVVLAHKYHDGVSGADIVTINDNLFVWVNDMKAAAGGTATTDAVLGGHVVPDFSEAFVTATLNFSVAPETGWYLAGGLSLFGVSDATDGPQPFINGPNAISLLADEFSALGGLGHLVVKIDKIDDACEFVEIDIKPGDDPNCFNIDGHGVIPVAILGRSDFAAQDIDLAAGLTFGGLEVRVKGNGDPMCSLEDVDSDGFDDLVCQFQDDPSFWLAGVDDATLHGQLIGGGSFTGTDEICIRP